MKKQVSSLSRVTLVESLSETPGHDKKETWSNFQPKSSDSFQPESSDLMKKKVSSLFLLTLVEK
jgi:hypothetical protein